MAKRPRKTQEACEHAESGQDAWAAAWRDRRITEEEAARITAWFAEHVGIDAHNDLSAAHALSSLHNGFDSPRSLRLGRELDTAA